MGSLFLMVLFHGVSTSFLSHGEIKLSFELMKNLEIRQCIFVGDLKTQDLISTTKEFSSVQVPTTYLNYESLVKYVAHPSIVSFSTGLVLKEENLDTLEEIFNDFEKVNRSYKLANFIWLIFLGHDAHFDKMIIPYDCRFIVIQLKNTGVYTLTEIYTVKKRQFSLNFGTWDTNFGLQTANDSFYRRSNFQKTELTVVSNSLLDSKYATHELKLFVSELLSGFAYRLNLTEVRNITKSGSEFDSTLIEVGDISAYHDPFHYGKSVDRIGPIARTNLPWYIKHPTVEIKSDYYLQPFSTNLWLALLFTVLLATVLIVPQNQKGFFVDNLFLGLESFCGQCGNDAIENSSLRLICISLRFTALILIGLYGATFASFFAVETFRPPFTNLEQFIANGEYQLLKYDEKDTVVNTFLPKMAGLENLTKFIPSKSNKETFRKVCRGKFAVYSKDDLRNMNLECRVYKIPQYLASYSYGLVLKRHSPFKKILSKNLIRFHEVGIKISKGKFRPGIFSEDSFHPIEMDQMNQVLAITFIGVLLGTTIMIIEISINRIFKKKTETNKEQEKLQQHKKSTL